MGGPDRFTRIGIILLSWITVGWSFLNFHSGRLKYKLKQFVFLLFIEHHIQKAILTQVSSLWRNLDTS